MITDVGNKSALLVKFGCQYYVAARFSMFVGLSPVAANLFHHAIEFLVKGHLAKKISSEELANKDTGGHNLKKLWKLFKNDFLKVDLSMHDQTINALHSWEAIRYPDKIVTKGMEASMIWESIEVYPKFPWASRLPKYRIVVENIDLLFVDICKTCNIDPKPLISPVPESVAAVSKLNKQADFFIGT